MYKSGRKELQFIQNRLGVNWFYGFMRRNVELSERLSENVKNNRTTVDDSIKNKTADHLETSLDEISPRNIINYAETNFTQTRKYTGHS